MKKNKSIILLSGGLDSVVSLALLLKTHNIELAVTFNYGQKASEKEIIAAKLLTQHYHIKHKVIELNWLKEITHTSLVSDEISLPNLEIDNLDNQEMAKKTAKSVWVPNRNGLFVNIAACFADSYNYSHIIIGANKEEAATFIDNGPEFINKINISLEHSTNNAPKVIAPLIDKTKNDIIKIAIDKNIPFNLIRSCYKNEEKHCGACESCNRLKRAIISNNRDDLLKLIF